MATQTVEISAQDARALRSADSICFDHLKDGTGRIRANLEAEHSSTGFEQTHVILAHSSRIESYERLAYDGSYTGFAMFQSARYSNVAQTLVRHLRTGSQFSLHWVRDNSSPVLVEAGLVRDELRINIQRKGSKVADTFIVDTFIGKDNSARMVKRA